MNVIEKFKVWLLKREIQHHINLVKKNIKRDVEKYRIREGYSVIHPGAFGVNRD